MYLLIFEDLTIKSTNEITDDDLNACEGGYLDIIDISGDDPLQWMSHGWVEVERVTKKSENLT